MSRLVCLLTAALLLTACGSNTNQTHDVLRSEAQHKRKQPTDLAGGFKEPTSRRASCYNLAMGEPSSLAGRLDYVVYPGPPNFEDIQTGDLPEPSYVLVLDRDICLTGDPDEFANPELMFNRVQLAVDRSQGMRLQSLVGRRVTLQLTDHIAAHTAHHHEPLVASVSSLLPSSSTANQPSSDDDVIESYGSAATTIRAFYAALGAGQGYAAAALVVPEKTARGAFAPNNLTRFYGNMTSPIELISITPSGPSQYLVSYSFTVTRTPCNGRAVVSTVQRNGRNYIAKIDALDGC